MINFNHSSFAQLKWSALAHCRVANHFASKCHIEVVLLLMPPQKTNKCKTTYSMALAWDCLSSCLVGFSYGEFKCTFTCV